MLSSNKFMILMQSMTELKKGLDLAIQSKIS